MRELFASLLFGWVAKSRENGQINGYRDCVSQSDRTRLIGSLFPLFPLYKFAIITLLVLIPSSGKVIDSLHYIQHSVTSNETLDRIISLGDSTHYSDSLRELFLYRLEKSDLFDSVTIDTFTRPDSSFIVQVELREKNQFYISSIGGGIYGTRYGEEVFPWLRLDFGVSYRNLNGTGQKLTLYGSLFRIRYIGALWDIPLSNDYFINAGALIGSHPSIYDSWHARVNFKSTVGIGKRLLQRNTIQFNLIPAYMEYEDNSSHSYDGYSELISAILWKTDLRDRGLNPRRGIYFSQNFRTNHLHPYRNNSGTEIRYTGGISDLRAYFAPGTKDFIFAAQLKADLIYSGSLNRYNKLYMGGTETVRGFPSGYYGEATIFNNMLTATAEFRFPIFSVNALNLSFLSWYDPSLKSFPFDISGALFSTAGYLWDNLENGFSTDALSHTVIGGGGGLRFHLPTLKMSLCGDLAFPLYGTKHGERAPTIHGYINLPF
jgi:outer membrane protein assembly factor BamA